MAVTDIRRALLEERGRATAGDIARGVDVGVAQAEFGGGAGAIGGATRTRLPGGAIQTTRGIAAEPEDVFRPETVAGARTPIASQQGVREAMLADVGRGAGLPISEIELTRMSGLKPSEKSKRAAFREQLAKGEDTFERRIREARESRERIARFGPEEATRRQKAGDIAAGERKAGEIESREEIEAGRRKSEAEGRGLTQQIEEDRLQARDLDRKQRAGTATEADKTRMVGIKTRSRDATVATIGGLQQALAKTEEDDVKASLQSAITGLGSQLKDINEDLTELTSVEDPSLGARQTTVDATQAVAPTAGAPVGDVDADGTADTAADANLAGAMQIANLDETARQKAIAEGRLTDRQIIAAEELVNATRSKARTEARNIVGQ